LRLENFGQRGSEVEPSLYERIFQVQATHWWYKSRERFLDVLLSGLPKGGMILDAGCGPGSMLHYFGSYGEVVGMDHYAPAVAMAASHFTGPLIQGAFRSLPFADGSFSLVVACEVLYHRSIPDVGEAVCELVRVVKPGGVLLIIDSANASCYSAHDLIAHGARRFTRGELIDVMKVAGLKVTHATYAYALLLPIVWLLRRCKSMFAISEEPGGELTETWKPLNNLLIHWFRLEAALAGRWGLPFGLSIQILGRKDMRKQG
jgi:ubiquinone/menaquinone biosynthesis C-methylase UbiE